MEPKFTNSLSNGSSVSCQPNTTCHIPVETNQTGGQCKQVKECGEGVAGTHVFKTTKVGDKCLTDIAIKTSEQENTDTLCISAGSGGEQREIMVVTEKSEEFGPCQTKHCLNRGFCNSTTATSAVCECPEEFTGEFCETDCSTTTTSHTTIAATELTSPTQSTTILISGVALETSAETKTLPTEFSTTEASTSTSANTGQPTTISGQQLIALAALTGQQPTTLSAHTGQPSTILAQTGQPITISGHTEQSTTISAQHGQPTTVSAHTGQPTTTSAHTAQPSIPLLTDTEQPTTISAQHGQPTTISGHTGQPTTTSAHTGRQPTTILAHAEQSTTISAQHGQPTTISEHTGQPTTISEHTGQLTSTSAHTGQPSTTSEQTISSSINTEQTTTSSVNTAVTSLNAGRSASTNQEMHWSTSTDASGLPSTTAFNHLTVERNEKGLNTSDHCDNKKAKQHAETMVKTGYASCFCVVHGKKVHVIKKRPVAQKKSMYKAAGFGAGGMAGTVAVGAVVYAIVNKVRKPKEVRRQPPVLKPRIHPQAKVTAVPPKPQLNF